MVHDLEVKMTSWADKTYAVDVENPGYGVVWGGYVNEADATKLLDAINAAVYEWDKIRKFEGRWELLKKLCNEAAKTIPGYKHD